MTDPKPHPTTEAEDALTRVFRLLRAGMDSGFGCGLDSRDCITAHTAIMDARSKAGTARALIDAANKRNAGMLDEVNALVTQVVDEEARAVRAEVKLARAAALLRAFVDDGNNDKTKRHTNKFRERAATLLKEIEG